MRLQVFGMMVCWSKWVVSLGNRGVGSQLFGGPVSGSDPRCHAGSRAKRPKGAFLAPIHIRVVLIGQKFLDCDWRTVQLRAKLLEAFFCVLFHFLPVLSDLTTVDLKNWARDVVEGHGGFPI